MRKLTLEYKILLILCCIVTILGALLLVYTEAIQSLILVIMGVAWFTAIDTPEHDKYILEDGTDFRD